MEIYNRYIRHRPYADQAALAVGVGMYGAQKAYKYLREQYHRRANSFYGQAVKGAFAAIKKNNNKQIEMAPIAKKRKRSTGSLKPSKKMKLTRAPKKVKKVRVKKSRTKKSSVVMPGIMNMKPVSTKYKKKNGILQYGINFTKESGADTLVDNDCVYIGHATASIDNVTFALACAMVKRLAIDVKLDTANIFATIALGAGDQWRLVYRNGYDQADTLVNHQYTAPASYRLYDVMTDWHSLLSAPRSTGFNIAYLEYVPGNPLTAYSKLNMVDASVRLSIFSELKIQNRTLSATGSTSTEVIDTVPISGKVYFGKGAGTTYVANTVAADPFIAEDDTGLILKLAAANPVLQEPPAPSNFGKVTKYGSVMLQPGEVKRSVLKTNVTYKVNDLLRLILQSTNEIFSQTTMGVFRFFALEKVLDVGAGDNKDIKVGYEHNLSVTCSLYYKRNQETASFRR